MRVRMVFVGVLTVVFGIWAAAGAFFEPLGKSILLLALWRWQAEPMTPAGLSGLAISGGVMVGWGATLIQLCRAPGLSQAEFAAIVRTGVWAWFVVDGAASIAAGAAPNLVPNTVLLALTLWATSNRGEAAGARAPGSEPLERATT
ncbi:MAG: hypothetical protein ACFB9M_19990 [Myxococcota bacterium]